MHYPDNSVLVAQVMVAPLQKVLMVLSILWGFSKELVSAFSGEIRGEISNYPSGVFLDLGDISCYVQC